jgi:hypothetical protein
MTTSVSPNIELRLVDVQSAELLATTFATGDASIGYKALVSLAQKLKKFLSSPLAQQ